MSSDLPMIDEVDLWDERTHRPAYMLLRAADSGGIAIEIEVSGARSRIELTVSRSDAQRLADRLADAAKEAATDEG